MALINRLSQLFKADFHAVLDHIEEPELLLRQSIREMEDALAENSNELASLNRDRQIQSQRINELQQNIDHFDEELDLCFSESEDSLARPLVRRKLEATQLKKILGKRQDTIVQHIEERQLQMDAHRQQLESMRQKAELFSQHNRCVETPAEHQYQVSDSDVDVAFLREKQRRANA